MRLTPPRSRRFDSLAASLLLATLACGPPGPTTWRDAEPSADLAPEDVVAAQLEGFRNNGADDGGIAVAFRFSSPANRRNTGPIERFALMIHDGPYELLLGFDGVSARPVETRNRDARQTVTVVRDGVSRVYHFFLSKQRGGSCDGCWMTDAVLVEDEAGESI